MKKTYFEKMGQVQPEQWTLKAAMVLEAIPNEHGETDYQYVRYAGDMEEQIAQGWYVNRQARCDHCNQPIKHFVVLSHGVTNDHIIVGWQCYDETFSYATQIELDLARAKKAAEAKIRHAEREAWTKEHAELYAFLQANRYNSFFGSLLNSVADWGSLTERQEEAAYKAMQKQAERDAEKADEPEAQDAPKGRITGKFKVLGMKLQESQYGTTLKMVAQHTDAGYKIWVTVPGNIQNGGVYRFPEHDDATVIPDWDFINSHHIEKDMVIELSVDLTPSDDPKFAYGKRPTKAKLISL